MDNAGLLRLSIQNFYSDPILPGPKANYNKFFFKVDLNVYFCLEFWFESPFWRYD